MAYDSKGTLNKVMLIGRLGQDPELKYTQSGAAVVTLSVATNTSYKAQDGGTVENTEWNRVVVWRKTAEFVSQYTKKGSRVYVEGRLVTRSWDDKDGNKRFTTEIQADQVQFLDSRADGGGASESGSATPPPPPEPPAVDNPDDDIPF